MFYFGKVREILDIVSSALIVLPPVVRAKRKMPQKPQTKVALGKIFFQSEKLRENEGLHVLNSGK